MAQLDKSSARIRGLFGEIARRYDLLNHLLSLGIDRSWRRRTARLAPPLDVAGPILDVCAGTGDLGLAYARAYPASRVVGADFCRPMLAVARQKCQSRAAGRIALVEADTLRLPFPADSFQVVSVAFGLRNLSDGPQGLREMVRVCRPGGRVAVLEFSTPRARPLAAVYAWYFHRVLPRIGQTLARNRQSAYNYLPASVRVFPPAEAVMEQMREAGLGSIELHRFSLGIVTLYVGTKPPSP